MENLEKIEKLFKMLASDNDGEVLNAVGLIKRSLKSQGKNVGDLATYLFNGQSRGTNFNSAMKDFEDFARTYGRAAPTPPRGFYSPPPPRKDQEMITLYNQLFDCTEHFNQWEIDFYKSMGIKLQLGHSLTENQRACLQKMHAKHFTG